MDCLRVRTADESEIPEIRPAAVGIGGDCCRVSTRTRVSSGGHMGEVVCNYAIARFRPYRETGELVNVGVVLVCPQVNYFGYLFETRKYKRVTDFFPELD